MKSISHLLFGSLLVSIPFIAYGASVFPDVNNHDYLVAIDYLQENRVIAGYPDGTFRPQNPVNRAEFTKIIIEATLGENPITSASDCFPDVSGSDWFASYVCYAKNNGVIAGYPDGTFKPANTINLAEASKILVNTFELPQSEVSDGLWYRPFIESMGVRIPPTLAAVSTSVNRAEMAEMIWRIQTNKLDQSFAQFDFDSNSMASINDELPEAGYDLGMCEVPEEAQLEDVSVPRTVVGNGSASSCTSEAVVSAVGLGGVITFNCGNEPVIIKMNETAKVINDTGPEIVIDGGGKVTLDGQGARRILYMNTCDEAQKWTTSHCNNQDHPRLTVQNMTFVNGASLDEESYGGGAIFARGGRLKVLNSRFFNNECTTVGTRAGGGAIRAFSQYENLPLYVVNSTFGGEEGYGNSCTSGGAISSIGVSYSVINSHFSHNLASGRGANPPKNGLPGGGNGAAIHNDGKTYTLNVCGSHIHDNHANEGGGAIFFVSNDRTGHLNIQDSLLENNVSEQFETDGHPGIFYLGDGPIQTQVNF